MDIAIGMPNAVPGTAGEQLSDWARRAERAGFSSLGTLDRLVYPSYDPLATLAGAATVTERIELKTTVLLLPYRLNAALTAKEAASVHKLSGGRLTLGVGLGWREDDYEASGLDYDERGKRMDEMLAEIERVWSGHEYGTAGGIGPDVSDDPPKLLIGGGVAAAFRRAARHGVGWILGGGTPEQFVDGKRRTEEAFRAAGRDEEPRNAALAYFSLGDRGEQSARDYLGHYYAAMGEQTAEAIIASAATDADTVRGYVQAFRDAGCDELFLFPCASDPDQVDLLAEVALAEIGSRA